jgi:hypothetical protein
MLKKKKKEEREEPRRVGSGFFIRGESNLPPSNKFE